MRCAASYARLSNIKLQSEINLDEQHRRNIAFLQELGYAVASNAIYEEGEGHHSGRKLKQRKAMQLLMAHLDRYQAVAFFDFTRFSRSVEFTFKFLELAKEKSVKIYNTLTRKEITLENAAAYLETGMQAIFAEYESVQASDRMLRAYARARANHYISQRRPPYGLRVIGNLDNRHFEKDPAKFKAAFIIIHQIASGKTYEDIVRYFRQHKIKFIGNRGIVKDFESHQVRRVALSIQLGHYKQFIDPATHDRAVRTIQARAGKRGKHAHKNPKQILAGLLHCKICGVAFSATQSSLFRGTLYMRYKHQERNCPCRYRSIVTHKLDALTFDYLGRWSQTLTDGDFVNRIIAQQSKPAPTEDDPAERRKELHQQLAQAKSKLLDNLGLAEEYAELKARIERELIDLDKKTVAPMPRKWTATHVRTMIQTPDQWQRMAQADPDKFALFLSELFSNVLVDIRSESPIIEFVPHKELEPYFKKMR